MPGLAVPDRSHRPSLWDLLERRAIGAFARAWHRCAVPESDPLPATGPAILIANHPSHADPAFLMASCRRPLHFLQARECYEVPLLRWLFARAGCIPVTRGGQDVGAIRLALKRLQQGNVLALFPEGDVRAAGPGKPGAALLALRSGAPVIPAWIAGGPRAATMLGAWLWPSSGVRVWFGPAIDLAGHAQRRISAALLRDVTTLLMERIRELRPVMAENAERLTSSPTAELDSRLLVKQDRSSGEQRSGTVRTAALSQDPS